MQNTKLAPNADTKQHIVIVAGEASGDLHAARLVNDLKKTHPNLCFSGIGGQHMQEAGVSLISDLARYGVTGILEVLQHFKTIKRAYRAMQAHLKAVKPDLLILVDYPGFNLRLAQYAKKVLGIKILYYISPQLWAWKAGRIKKIQASIDHMAVIFPFEKKIYEDANVDVSFVGHPLTEKSQELESFRKKPTKQSLGLPEHQPLLAVLPGSRINEIDRHLPILYKTAKKLLSQYPDLHCVIPVANTLSTEQITKHWDIEKVPCTLIQHQKATDVANLSDAIVVASGTASLECALLGKPMCIIYKIGMVSALAASIFLRVQYVGLCNLLSNRMIVPELLQYDFTPKELSRVLAQLLDKKTKKGLSDNISNALAQLENTLSAEEADIPLHQLVLLTLAQEKKIALMS